jgi:hypothetical protein
MPQWHPGEWQAQRLAERCHLKAPRNSFRAFPSMICPGRAIGPKATVRHRREMNEALSERLLNAELGEYPIG